MLILDSKLLGGSGLIFTVGVLIWSYVLVLVFWTSFKISSLYHGAFGFEQ